MYPAVHEDGNCPDFIEFQHLLQEAMKDSMFEDLPCLQCHGVLPADAARISEEVIYNVNAACLRANVALLCVKAEWWCKSSPNQTSRGLWTLQFIRAYPTRKFLKNLDNCKLSTDLKHKLNGTLRGGKAEASGKAVTHALTESYKVLPQKPRRMKSYHKRVPTPGGWVYLQRVPNVRVFNYIFERVPCPLCQA